MLSQAYLPQIIYSRDLNNITTNTLSVVVGIVFLAALAQISILLPNSPVPITGQTFGVLLLSIIWGKKRAVATTCSYLILGFCGLPVFAAVKSAALFGATSGYLLGMLIAAYIVGTLADKGYTTTISKSIVVTVLGHSIIFIVGLFVLSSFVPKGSLLALGLIPFLPGAIIKTMLVALVAPQFTPKVNKRDLSS